MIIVLGSIFYNILIIYLLLRVEELTVLEIRDLHVSVEGKEILKGVNLKINQGEVHAVMGPNGSGKSTLAFALMGHPKYKITQGEILIGGKNVAETSTNERARLGLFLGFQYPTEVSGVSLFNFLKTAYNSIHQDNGKVSAMEFREMIREKMKMLNIDESFMNRYLNEGFSGGEKKRGEILQMAILNPKIAVLDETDSGLDVDSLKVVASGINRIANPQNGILLITHYQRILRYIKPNFVHIMIDGKIVLSGGEKLAEELEEKGYDFVKKVDANA